MMLEMLLRDGRSEQDLSGNRTFDALVVAGRGVFIERGYHNTRGRRSCCRGGVSYGAFYRYFRNKDELARLLTACGCNPSELPLRRSRTSPRSKDLRAGWSFADGSACITVRTPTRRQCCAVRLDAAIQEPSIRAASAPLLDWGRRRMSRYLRPWSLGDVEMEAVIMVALLGVLGARQRTAGEVDAAAHIIERGLLGR